jgi:hypothetical protein
MVQFSELPGAGRLSPRLCFLSKCNCFQWHNPTIVRSKSGPNFCIWQLCPSCTFLISSIFVARQINLRLLRLSLTHALMGNCGGGWRRASLLSSSSFHGTGAVWSKTWFMQVDIEERESGQSLFYFHLETSFVQTIGEKEREREREREWERERERERVIGITVELIFVTVTKVEWYKVARTCIFVRSFPGFSSLARTLVDAQEHVHRGSIA